MSHPSYCIQCGKPLELRTVDQRRRLSCTADQCGWVFWDNPTPVVAAVVEKDDAVLLVRSKGWPEKWFGLVAGFLEKDETPEDAVVRELKEETGLDGRIESFIGIYTFKEKNQIIVAYHLSARGTVLLGDELEAHKWIPVHKVRPWPLGTGPALKDWLDRRCVSTS